MKLNKYTRKEFIEAEVNLDSDRFVGVLKELPVKGGELQEDFKDYILTVEVDAEDMVAVKKIRDTLREQYSSHSFNLQRIKSEDEFSLNYVVQNNEDFISKIEDGIKARIRSKKEVKESSLKI